MAINYRKSKNKISFLKRNRYCFDTFLGRHHICRPLDTTLDIHIGLNIYYSVTPSFLHAVSA